jgi:tetratricopeptide (TPR) repeat protein
MDGPDGGSDLDGLIETVRERLRRAIPGSGEEAGLAVDLTDLLIERYCGRALAGDQAGARGDLAESVCWLDALMARTSPGSPGYAPLAQRAGDARAERWELVEDPADRDAAIGYLSAFVGVTAPSDPELPAVHAFLARAYAARAEDEVPGDEQEADLDSAIGHARSGLAAVPPQEPDLGPAAVGSPGPDLGTQLRMILGLALYDQFTAAANRLGPDATDGVHEARASRDDAISELSAGLDAIAPGEPAWALIADGLGRALHDRYTDPWPEAAPPDPADLDRAIDVLLAAAVREPDPRTAAYLVFALSDRLDARPDPADRDLLISWCRQLLDSEAGAGADGNIFREPLAMALADRAEANPRTRDADLGAAIEAWEAALAATPAEDPDRASLVTALAHTCWQRLGGGASRYDEVDRMTSYARQAWQLLPGDHEDRALIGFYVATGVHERLLRADEPFDLEAASLAIDILAQIEPLFADDPPLHLLAIVTLGHFLVARGQAAGSAGDVAAAQPWLLQGLARLPAGDPEWSEIAHTLAAGMSALASLGMDADHLDQAISLLTTLGRHDPDPARAAMTRGTLGILLVHRASFTGGGNDLDDGITHLTASYEQAPAGHAYRLAAAVNLAGALLTRFFERGQAEDVDAARFYLDLADMFTGPAGNAIRSLMADVDPAIAANRGILAAIEGMQGNPGRLDNALAELRAALAMLPPAHPHRDRLRCDIGLVLALRATRGGDQAADLRAAAAEIAAAALPGNHLMRPMTLLRAGSVLAGSAAAAGNPELLRAAISFLSGTLRELDPRFGARFRFVAVLGAAAEALNGMTRDPADLRSAIAWLEEARHDLAHQPAHPQYANCLIRLAHAYRLRGNTELALDAAFAALRGRGRDVLLQSGTARSLGFARIAAAEATEVAAWCLDGHQLGRAIEALELGRGLILHAATTVAELPELLAAAGHPELAEEWRHAAASMGDAPWDVGVPGAGYLPGLLAGTTALLTPDDLRVRVFAALAGSATEERLVRPPAPAEIAAALAETGADALVYLLAPGDGRAVLVPAAGRTAAALAEIPLAAPRGAMESLLGEYAAASAAIVARPAHGDGASTLDHQELSAARKTARRKAVRRWHQALDDVCDWAWPAVMLPILSRVREWGLDRPARLVLIGSGPLSMVPWHAARSRSAGPASPRYAIQDAVISYAASGRQLVELSRRPARPLAAAPVIVGDPTDTLRNAVLEARGILDVCYPAARYLGPTTPGWGKPADGPGTPDEILRQLPAADSPGASMLHLGCHGAVVGSAPGRSHLVLAGMQPLPVDAILRQARGRPPRAPGGLVSLAACTSDLTAAEHDEALTPATAFLAAGAVTAVGARWQIPDDSTSLLMFMFHFLMVAHGHQPRDALRLAQLWMLAPDRVAPPEMPPELVKNAADPQLAKVIAWAGIVHQGR